MLKRALLYLRRTYPRSILLLLLLFVISLSLSIGLSVWGSISSVTKEVQRQLGTSFIFKLPAGMDPQNMDYSQVVTLANGAPTTAYAGPGLDRDFAQQIMQVDGIYAYDGELSCWMTASDLELVPGMTNELYRRAMTDDHWKRNLEQNSKGYGELQSYELRRRGTVIYGNTDTSLYNKFRTGAFELVSGRHITANDRQKVLISEQIAQINGLELGDTFRISLLGINIGLYDDISKNLGETELEVVGIFHVNGYQPTGLYVSEFEITYNWLLTDEFTVEMFDRFYDQAYYQNFINDLRYDNLTFFVDDPAKLDQIVDEVKHLDVDGIGFFDLSLDDSMYQSTVNPLNAIRNLIAGLMLAIVIGCAIVLLIVFTMWVKSRRREIAIYLSLSLSKGVIVGQLLVEAVIVALIACALACPISQPIANFAGNQMLASAIQEAQPKGPQTYTEEQLYQAARNGTVRELFAYENSSYSGPDEIDFALGAPELAVLILAELLIISGAICKGASFLFSMQPRQLMTELR